MVAVTLSELPSACPDERLRSDARVDPYWSGMWDLSSSAAWTSRDTAVRRAQMGLTRLPKKAGVEITKDAAIDSLVGWGRARRLRALAAVAMWRTMTVQQLAAFTGHTTLASPTSADRTLLWCSGLLENGTCVTDSRTHLPALVRTDPRADFDALVTRLSFAEQIGVSAGQPWKWGSQYDRHNAITCELGLRVAEYCPGVGTVLGESLAGADLLMGGDGSSGGGSRAGDMVIVRDDGLRIVIETTATLNAHTKRKIDRWADVLSKRTERDTIVVFVEVAHPDRRGRRSEVQRLLRKYIREVTTASLEAQVFGLDQMFAVARWQDWFPAPGMIDVTFPGLPVHRATGDAGDPWEPVNLLDPFDVDFTPGPNASAILANAALLLGTPYWLTPAAVPTDVESWMTSRLDTDARPVPAHAAIAHNADRAWRNPEPLVPAAADTFAW